MERTFAVINEMVADGVLENYAVAGAIGAMFLSQRGVVLEALNDILKRHGLADRFAEYQKRRAQ